ESYSDEKVKIYGKVEEFNRGGSVKDRVGKYLVEEGIEEGGVEGGDSIVEGRGGNSGIGLGIGGNG
ncbi:pyridoxal-phosphate dependent enzyme, partial [Staphylococcus pasteuri]|uniref:pyridoxal-phosphate dependent enzyme n=1 Tax=Staphylococcus pasteuri TaxID=45972 RepID=UPI0036F23545